MYIAAIFLSLLPMKTTENIYACWHEPQLSCLLVIRQIILNSDTHITETVKYGMPCFLYLGKAFCYLWVDKQTKEPYILMVDGLQMKHPLLVQGERKRMCILSINPEEDLPINTIKEVLTEGLALRA